MSGVPHCRLAVSRISEYQWLCDLGLDVDNFWAAIGFMFDNGLAVLRLDHHIARFLIDLADQSPIAIANIQHFRFSFLENVVSALNSHWKRKTVSYKDLQNFFSSHISGLAGCLL